MLRIKTFVRTFADFPIGGNDRRLLVEAARFRLDLSSANDIGTSNKRNIPNCNYVCK